MSDVSYSPRMDNWDIKWNGNSLGNGQVDPTGLKIVTKPITRASSGGIVLGHFIVGLEGTLKVTCQDVTLLLQQNNTPWYGGSGSIPLVPTSMNANAYSFAQPLVLHPHAIVASDHSEDLTLVKCTPLTVVNMKRDGDTNDMWVVEFQPYPDLAKLQATPSVVLYGYVGATSPA